MYILSIESSCDDTAVSVAQATPEKIEILSSIISSQTQLHAKWGGVVPNLAAREHLKNFLPVLELALREAGIQSHTEIDLITVTHGPGLIPALMIGVDAARTLAYLWQKPLVGVHHIEGHIYANFIEDKIGVSSKSQTLPAGRQVPISKQILKTKNPTSPAGGQKPQTNFPVLCLVVSGGHTQLVLMKKHLEYEIIGETLDDAAGEAFDKVARILGLGYPGGPAIAAGAAKFKVQSSKFKEKSKIPNTKYQILNTKLPRPMLNKNNFDFSFSGLKTAVLYKTKQLKTINYKLKTALCAEFQQAVIDVLIHKTLKAAQKYNPKTIILAGGVSANQELRQQLNEAIKKNLPNTKYQIPDTKYSIDNAAMIAVAGYYRWQNMNAQQKNAAKAAWQTLQANAQLKLTKN